MELINLKTGTLYFGNKEYITAKTTFEEVLKMNETIDNSFENLEMGIQNIAFNCKNTDVFTKFPFILVLGNCV